MTTTKSSTRASVAVIVADVLLLQSRLELPALEDLYATSSNGIVTLNLYSADAQVLWADALNIPVSTRSVHRYEDRSPIHTAYAERLGWSVHVKYDGPDQPGETLPAETVASLEQIATADAEPLERDDWENDFSNCPRCGKPRANSWTDHCVPCDGPLVEVTAQPTAEAVDRG